MADTSIICRMNKENSEVDLQAIFQLYKLVGQLGTCKQIIHTCNEFCVSPGENVNDWSLRRPTRINDAISENSAASSRSIL